MPNPLLTKVVAKHLRQVPEFRPGDTIRVHVKIKEGDKERLQAFEGTVIARNNAGLGATVTVKLMPLLARVLTVTTTLPVVAPEGTGTTMLVADQLVPAG